MNSEDVAVRNFRDFLMIYNKMSETCFNHCVRNLNQRDLTTDEVHCVEKCAAKNININHKVMAIYMEVQPEIINKRVEAATKASQFSENSSNTVDISQGTA
ncbi:mitochondrial import inner membrane translocase subunit Tim10 B-like [Limulus polyphemus]|uniref:Mitochondrial import inner membrane translocase subunit n=1 Tax=Limulus polyphemus TaxID=6850 RepID=A0ABM1BX19_LIMPO|nr:mitochondrial import inner membrane translocase subunit Tim10 B-like [Limulus polyphemus]XP_013790317.1 mitochondrial import inner membrane translocase subunit Tim10 B-like [Limulus polyphemus]XP_022258247.1 mitochondrial import inner membrane translocase subunit Tim10 B-like [Limulus polyphemus]XP_022258248.1 mitochondrial import inner membrane translocase subunit Tim10 B-like [Limulus polyphemus]